MQERGERLRDRGLSGAWRAEEEDRSAAVDGRTELTERPLGKDEVRERLPQRLERDLHVADRLRPHPRDVRGERHRRGADVAVPVHRFLRAFGALLRDDVDVRRGGDARSALHLDEMLVAEEVEGRLKDLRQRKAERVRELRRVGLTLLVEKLQREVGDEGRRQARLLKGLGREWSALPGPEHELQPGLSAG